MALGKGGAPTASPAPMAPHSAMGKGASPMGGSSFNPNTQLPSLPALKTPQAAGGVIAPGRSGGPQLSAPPALPKLGGPNMGGPPRMGGY